MFIYKGRVAFGGIFGCNNQQFNEGEYLSFVRRMTKYIVRMNCPDSQTMTEAACSRLIEAANKQGGDDNITRHR